MLHISRTRILFCFSIVWFFSCSSLDDIVKDTEETMNEAEGLYGDLVDESGNELEGVLVKVHRISDEIGDGDSLVAVGAIIDSVLTDATGRYAFADLKAGTFNISGNYKPSSGEGGELAVLIDSVTYDGDIAQVPTATLKKPGSIAGVVKTYTGDNEFVFCYIPGTSYLALTDAEGNFTISGIPEGENFTMYVRKADNTLKTSIVSGITVISDETVTLDDTVRMVANPAANPSTPMNLRATYDQINYTVHLSWDTVHVEDLKGYKVYRYDTTATPGDAKNASPITEPLFEDNDFYFITFPYSYFVKDTSKYFYYTVKSVDNDGNVSESYAKPVLVQVSSPRPFRIFFAETRHDETYQDTFSLNRSLAGLTGDSVTIAAPALEIGDSCTLDSITYDFNSDGDIDAKTEKATDVKWLTSAGGAFICVVSVYYNNGTVTRASFAITMIEKLNGMVKINAGDYQEGSPERKIRFTYSFYMDTAEVTQAQFETAMGYNPSLCNGAQTWEPAGSGPLSHDFGSRPNRPVDRVNFYDAALYCNARSKAESLDTVYSYTAKIDSAISMYTGVDTVPYLSEIAVNWDASGYRLPTEGEWRIASRGGNGIGKYFWTTVDYSQSNIGPGDPIIDTINMYSVWHYNAKALGVGNEAYGTHTVASKMPNNFGLYDVLGNVAEWTNNWIPSTGYVWTVDPIQIDPKGAEGTAAGTQKTIAGGSWIGTGSGSDHASLTCASILQEEAINRVGGSQNSAQYGSFGFRCVRKAQ